LISVEGAASHPDLIFIEIPSAGSRKTDIVEVMVTDLGLGETTGQAPNQKGLSRVSLLPLDNTGQR